MIIIDINDIAKHQDFFKIIQYDSMPEVDNILLGVKTKGDSFLKEISAKFNDGIFNSSEDFVVSEGEIEDAYNKVDKEFVNNIKIAKQNIEEFSKRQFNTISNFSFEIKNSILGHKICPLNKVLCYVPGGNYPLPSSCLMTVIPAKIAGVKEIYLTSPRIKPETIVAANIAGANKIYKLGGAQSIAAFAYGTESIMPVDKIVGPGNKFVTYAKKYVFGDVDIDFLAGPSEVLVIADETANPKLVAADLLAQCEHDKDARGYLICTSFEFAKKVDEHAKEFLSQLKTRDIAAISYEKSYAVISDNISKTIEIVNKRAPEHLELIVKDENLYLDKLKNYGSLFIGNYCAEVFGDYTSGTNHVLPTNGASRYTGGLSVFDFIKILTYQKIDKEYAKILAKNASYLARQEGLYAHKLASDLRGNI